MDSSIQQRITAACVAIVLAVTTRTAAAQSSRLVLAGGIGQGSGWPTCDACTGIDHRQGLTGYLRAGAFITQTVALSAEYNKWMNNSSDADSQFQSLLAVAQLYAPPIPGLSLKVGAGVGGSIIRFNGGGGELTSTGFAYLLGLGYDFPVVPRLAVTPFVDFLGTTGASENFSLGAGSGTLDGNVLRFGVGLSVR